jgi:chromate transporter
LVRRTFVETSNWVSEEEFGRYWNLCQLAPGINLIALTILIGNKLGGKLGILVSMAGMLVPSAGITCLLAAGFSSVQSFPAVKAILKGVVPATAGIMFLLAIQFGRPLIKQGKAEGKLSLAASLLIIVVCAAVLVFLQISVLLVLAGAALTGAVVFTLLLERKAEEKGGAK